MVAVVGMDYFFITTKGVFKEVAEAKKNIETQSDRDFKAARLAGKVVKCLLVTCSLVPS